jgi:transcription elongation factor Elf1
MKDRRKCPRCGYAFEKNTSLEDEKVKPRIGDISFCINCGQVSKFWENDTMLPIKLDDLDKDALMEILKIRKAWKESQYE